MINSFTSFRRVCMDVARALSFRSVAIQPIAGHKGPWTIAILLLFAGSMLSFRHDSPEFGWPMAAGVAVLVVAMLAFWSRMDAESLQRSYVSAAIFCATSLVDGLSGQNAAGTAVMILTCAWGLLAWIAYMVQRIRATG